MFKYALLIALMLPVAMAQAGTITTHAIARVKLPVGETISPNVTIPAGTKQIMLQINAATWADPTVLVSFFADRSDDGGVSWQPIASVTTTGDAQTKNGKPPVFTLTFMDALGNSTLAAPILARARVTTNKSITFGLDVSVIN